MYLTVDEILKECKYTIELLKKDEREYWVCVDDKCYKITPKQFLFFYKKLKREIYSLTIKEILKVVSKLKWEIKRNLEKGHTFTPEEDKFILKQLEDFDTKFKEEIIKEDNKVYHIIVNRDGFKYIFMEENYDPLIDEVDIVFYYPTEYRIRYFLLDVYIFTKLRKRFR